MNKKEIPIIKLNKYKPNYSDEINQAFNRLNFTGKLAEIRKQQILNHPYVSEIVYCLSGLSNMIGQMDNEINRIRIEIFQKRLVELHSPVYLNEPIVWEESACWGEYEWKELSFDELYNRYILLCNEKQWEFFYGCNDDIKFWENAFKNYQIVDMLNDLQMYNKILEYDVRSFMKFNNSLLPEVTDDELLSDFDMNRRIAVNVLCNFKGDYNG